MLWILLLGLILGLWIYKIKSCQTYWERKGINFIPPTFFIGNISLLGRKAFGEQIIDFYNYFSNNRYHGVYQFLKPTLLIKDPELIKQITVKQFENFADHPRTISAEVDPLWNNNLATLTGDRWKDMRATLSPSFTSSKMKIMFHLINECAQYFTEFFQEDLDNSTLAEYEMKDIFTRYTNDVIASAAFGLRCNSLKEKNNDFYLTGKEATDFKGIKGLTFFANAISPTLCKWLRLRVFSKKVEHYFSNIIREAVKTREQNNIVRPDMIHLLMEARKGRDQQEEDIKINKEFSSVDESTVLPTKKRPISMDDIIAQAMIFFLAGFDTVSTLLSFLFYEIAVNPTIQDRLRLELLSINNELNYEQLLNMRYLDMVISETLRKWPPAVATDRLVTKPVTIEPTTSDEKRLEIDVDTVIWLPIYAIHRDPKYYLEPEKFDPERFSDENKHQINSSTYLPFGVGPRNCIGSRFALLECKLLVYHILKSFEIVPVKRTYIPMVLSAVDLNLAPKGGMWLGFKKLN